MGVRPGPGRFAFGSDPVPMLQESAWTPGSDRTGAEYLAHTGVQTF